MADLAELCPCQVPGSVYVQRLAELAHDELLLLDAVSDLTHATEDKLNIAHVPLHLDDAFAHLLLHAARTNLRRDV